MTPYASQRYFETSVQTASPGAILLALYDGAVRFAHEAADAIRNNEVARKGERIGRVMGIVAELQATLDRSRAPDLAARLESLYEYMLARLHHANLAMDARAAEEVANLLGTLREGWRGAMATGAGAATAVAGRR